MSQKPSAPLRARLRPDLIAVPIEGSGERSWHVKDPVSLRFFQFDQRELGVLQMLDGRSTIEEILRRFCREFAPLHLSARQLLFFVDAAGQNGLLILEQPPGHPASDAWSVKPGARIGQWLGRLNPLAIRLPGLDPDPFLDAAYPFLRWCFSRAAMALGCLLVAAALLLAAMRFEEFLARLPSREQFFTPQSLLWMALALAFTKIAHELAHAFACKHFGGECHELGVMLLVFVPCLYCNVSDSWLLARKRERMLITAAGIWMELLLAAGATFMWWFAVDGPVRMAALSVMFVCSVSTLLLNGNPLMRYDGYYLLSDAVGVPNLASESGRLLRDVWRRWGLGIVDALPDRPGRPRAMLAIYGVLSFCYRVFLFGVILLAVHAMGEAHQLQTLAWMITPLAIAGLVLPPLIQTTAPLARRAERRRIQPRHLGATALIAAVTLAGVALVPVPKSVRAPFLLEADGAERIFVTTPGRLVEARPAGSLVEAGEIVGRLANLALSRELQTLSARRDLLKRQLEILTSTRGDDEETAARIPATRQALADAEDQLRTLQSNLSRLTLKSSRPGTVLHPPNSPRAPTEREASPTWSGSPLEDANLGCWLEVGTEFCLIGEADYLAATVMAAQEDVVSIRPGQPVELLLSGAADRTFSGTVVEVSAAPVDELPRELAALQLVPVDVESANEGRPLEPTYRVRVRLDAAEAGPLVRWSTGEARIRLPPEPLVYRIRRAAQRTFHFDL
jgi:putative peptide zinc metalloprotease protein